MSYSGGFISDSNGVAQGINGAVFITDVTPTAQGNVGAKVFSSQGKVLDQCVSDTDQVTVFILAQTGHTHYMPAVLINGLPVPLTEDEDKTVWIGNIAIDLAGASTIVAVHEDGSAHTVSITQDIGPEITSAEFTGGYPGSQTELKAGDSFGLLFATDQDAVEIEIDDFGASSGERFTIAPANNGTLTLNVTDRGNAPQQFGVRVRSKNSNGSFGSWFETSSAGTTDGQHRVTLNNRYPAGSINQVTYPAGQQALKGSEGATLELSASDFDQVVFTAPNGELNIANVTVFESSKSVARASGSYNVSVLNFEMRLTKASNGAQTIVDEVVRIAQATPQISIATPVARLRSGGSFGSVEQAHELTISADQQLLETPVIAAPAGTLHGSASGAVPGATFSQVLQVHDNDAKGQHAFTLVAAKNLAGIVTTVISSGEHYELGGFVPRTFEMPAFNREHPIGSAVVDLSKVRVADPDSRSMTHHAQFGNQLLGYTITGPSNTINPNGTLFYWLDDQAVQNNTTGRADIMIEELV